MIYTSYFAQMRNFPSNYYPIAISQYPPKWYEGAVCKGLAPTPEILGTWNRCAKNTVPGSAERLKWEEWYIKEYKTQILKEKKVDDIIGILKESLPFTVQELEKMYPEPIWENPDIHIVLLCFEKTGDFCHRNLVSQWFNEHGIKCKEATKDDMLKEQLGLSIIEQPIEMER